MIPTPHQTKRAAWRGCACLAAAWVLLASATAPSRAADDPAQVAMSKRTFAQTVVAYEQRAAKGDVDAARRAGEVLLHADRLSIGAVSRDMPHAIGRPQRATTAGDASTAATPERVAPTTQPQDPVYEPGPHGC